MLREPDVNEPHGVCRFCNRRYPVRFEWCRACNAALWTVEPTPRGRLYHSPGSLSPAAIASLSEAA